MLQATIGERLVQAGYITACQLQSALAFQRGWEGRVGLTAALVKLGFLSTSQASEVARFLTDEHRGDATEPSTSPGVEPAANDAVKAVAAAA